MFPSVSQDAHSFGGHQQSLLPILPRPLRPPLSAHSCPQTPGAACGLASTSSPSQAAATFLLRWSWRYGDFAPLAKRRFYHEVCH